MPAQMVFTRLDAHPCGTIVRLASSSFAAYFARDPARQKLWMAEWRSYDREVFERPEVAASGFVSCLHGSPVGMASWCPTAFPGTARIGLNCVLPDFRGRGLGRGQIREALRILRERGVHVVRVTTGRDPFFRPARRMYEACGFAETGRRCKEDDPGFRVVDYALTL